MSQTKNYLRNVDNFLQVTHVYYRNSRYIKKARFVVDHPVIEFFPTHFERYEREIERYQSVVLKPYGSTAVDTVSRYSRSITLRTKSCHRRDVIIMCLLAEILMVPSAGETGRKCGVQGLRFRGSVS